MVTQTEHDAAHPGKRCRACPDTIASERRLRDSAARLRLPWWRRLWK